MRTPRDDAPSRRIESGEDLEMAEEDKYSRRLLKHIGWSLLVGAVVTTLSVYTRAPIRKALWAARANKVLWDGHSEAPGLTTECAAGEASPFPLYCVVDLSGGPTATTYPVSTLDGHRGWWSDAYKTTNLVLRLIQPGSLPGAKVSEPFYMGVFEVTQKQYELVTGERPSHFTGHEMRPVESVSYESVRGKQKEERELDEPISPLSFVGILRAKTGLAFDIPTSDQWKFSCFAGKAKKKSVWYDYSRGDYMWCLENSGSETHEVGTRLPNAWGLYDMCGNVWEWCRDSRVRCYFNGGSCRTEVDLCTLCLGAWGCDDGGSREIGFRLCTSIPSAVKTTE